MNVNEIYEAMKRLTYPIVCFSVLPRAILFVHSLSQYVLRVDIFGMPYANSNDNKYYMMQTTSIRRSLR